MFAFCSPRALAACTQVSYKFLALASPILHREVFVRDHVQLHKLFLRTRTGTKKTAPVSQDIAPFLCPSQIETMHVLYPTSSVSMCTLPRGRIIKRLALPLRVCELVLHQGEGLSAHTGTTSASLFRSISPTHLVLLCNLNHKRPSYVDRQVLALYDGIVQELTLVNGVFTQASQLLARNEPILRIVLTDPMGVTATPGQLLPDLKSQGTIAFTGFAGRTGCVIIEVAGEGERSVIESGRAALTAEESTIVEVRVKGSKWWKLA